MERRGGTVSAAPSRMLASLLAVAMMRNSRSGSCLLNAEMAYPDELTRAWPCGGAAQAILPMTRDCFGSSIDAARVAHCRPIVAASCWKAIEHSSLAADANPRCA